MNKYMLLPIVLLSACASIVDVQKPIEGNQGRVIVNRLASLSGMFETVHVKIDEVEYFTLGNGDSNYVDLPAGTHTIHTDHFLGSGADSAFNLKAGETVTYQTGWFTMGLKTQGPVVIPASQFNLSEVHPKN